MHPDLVGVGFDDTSMSMMMQSQGYATTNETGAGVAGAVSDGGASVPMSNMPTLAVLPVK